MTDSLITYKRQHAKGRGALDNTEGRFEKRQHERDADDWQNQADIEAYEEEFAQNQIPTQTFADKTRTIIATNDSPDVGMEATINPYRGCEHGCIYCYARPGHEYFGLSAGLDFETKIFVKHQAPVLLERELQAPKWEPKVLFFSGVTDCYQPVEREFKLTRQCLEVASDFKNPVALITKNFLVTRDIDILSDMARQNLSYVSLSITSLDGQLSRKMEPRASQPYLRLKAVEMLAKAGVPVGIMIGPTIPGLTDHEIPAILKAAADAGAKSAHYTMLRLPYGVKDHFQTWLQEHFPDRAGRVLGHIKDVRGGKLYDSAFGDRMRGTGVYAEHIDNMMTLFKKQYKLDGYIPPLTTLLFNRHARDPQGRLF